MNIGFVYKVVLVLFDESIGYFLYDNGNKFTFPSKGLIKSFINRTLTQE